MKAALCKSLGGPDAIVIEDIAEPVAGPGEALVRVKAAARAREEGGCGGSHMSPGMVRCGRGRAQAAGGTVGQPQSAQSLATAA